MMVSFFWVGYLAFVFLFFSLGVSYVCMYFYYYYFCYGLFVVAQDLGSGRVILGDSLMLCEGEYYRTHWVGIYHEWGLRIR